MYEEGVYYIDMSQEDLVFELKRMKQRLLIFQRNQEMQQQEEELAKNKADSSDNKQLIDQLYKQNARIQRLQSTVTLLYGKYAVVLRNMQLERQALSEIQQSCAKYGEFVQHKIESVKDEIKMKTAACMSNLVAENNELKESNKRAKYDMDCARIMAEEQRTELISTKAELQKALLARKIDEGEGDSNYLSRENQLAKKRNEELLQKVQEMDDKIMSMDERYRKELLELCEEKDLEIQTKSTEADALRLAGSDLRAAASKLTAEVSALRQKNSALEEENKAKAGLEAKFLAEVSELRRRISEQDDQVATLLSLNDKVQSDFKAVLSREEMLRKEKTNECKDMGDLRHKLASIQRKLMELEEDHAAEMKRISSENDELKRKVESSTKSCDIAERAASAYSSENEKLVEKVKVSEEQRAAAVSEAEKTVSEWKAKHAAEATKAASWETRYNSEKKQSGTDLDALREARDGATRQFVELKRQYNELQSYKKMWEDEKELLVNSNKELRMEVLTLKQQLGKGLESKKTEEEAAATIATLERTVADLKQCIHRECEERTGMIIEISELRDEIARLSHANNSIASGGEGGGAMASPAAPNSSKNGTSAPLPLHPPVAAGTGIGAGGSKKMSSYPTAPGGPGKAPMNNSISAKRSSSGSGSQLLSGEYVDTEMQPFTNGNLSGSEGEGAGPGDRAWAAKFKKGGAAGGSSKQRR